MWLQEELELKLSIFDLRVDPKGILRPRRRPGRNPPQSGEGRLSDPQFSPPKNRIIIFIIDESSIGYYEHPRYSIVHYKFIALSCKHSTRPQDHSSLRETHSQGPTPSDNVDGRKNSKTVAGLTRLRTFDSGRTRRPQEGRSDIFRPAPAGGR
jgi:hypothetical protein